MDKLKINGKIYKHISTFEAPTGTLRVRIFRAKHRPDVLKIKGGYWIEENDPIL